MRTILALAFLATPLHGSPAQKALSPAEFEALHALIRPQAGEFAWYEDIPWLTSIQSAIEKASAEGRPILVWCSADGQPCGATWHQGFTGRVLTFYTESKEARIAMIRDRFVPVILDGYLRYDARKDAFDRFDIVALGEGWGGGPKQAATTNFYRGGEHRRWPMGIAFRLLNTRRPIDLIPPQNANPYRCGDAYFKVAASGD